MEGARRCSDQLWGSLATGVADAPSCISDCRQKFLRALLPHDETFETLCERLFDGGNMAEKDSMFWALYCCDSQLCGVDNLESGGEDPNVNWVINTCQNLGYGSIEDPGPPQLGYSCNSATLFGNGENCRKAHRLDHNTSEIQVPGDLSTPVSVQESTSMATSTASAVHDPSLQASVDPETSDENDSGAHRQLSTGIKVTIGLSTLAGILLIALAVFCIMRYRSRPPHRRKAFRQLIHPDTSLDQAGSPTPLVSPTFSHRDADGVPLTPPPPLKERRLLDTSANSRPSSASQLRSHSGFPASPVFAPMVDKMVPRAARIPKTYGAVVSPPTSPLGWMTTAEGSVRSFSSVRTPTESIVTISHNQEMPFAASTRSHRSRDTTTDIPSPGPPPMRALPSTPPNGGGSQSSTAASSVKHGQIGVAIGVVTHNPAKGVVLAKESRDLCDMTEKYGLKKQNSWDSWTGGGGVGPGPSFPSLERSVSNPAMGEEDLERLGGRY